MRELGGNSLVVSAGVLLAVGPAMAEQSGWRLTPPMKLGLAVETIASTPPHDPLAGSRGRICRILARSAAQLGETRRGAALRTSMAAKGCGIAAPDERVWTWPWRDAGRDGVLPPLRRASFKEWSLHCGSVGRRQRCAAVHQGGLTPASSGAAHITAGFTTHFVIDRIAGEWRPIWRIFVAKPIEPSAGRERTPSPMPGSDLALTVHFGGERTTHHERLRHCGVHGCLLEMPLRTSERATEALRSGLGIQLSLGQLEAGRTHELATGSVNAAGSRGALAELHRLQQSENDTLAESEYWRQ